MKAKLAKKTRKRRWTTYYGGMSKGYPATEEGAMKSLARHLVDTGKRTCTVTDLDGTPVARAYHSGIWGLTIVPITKSKK